jgi:Ca2+-binding EF-hand superfamily protein
MRNFGTRQVKMTGLAFIAMAAASWAADVPGPIDSLQDLQDTGKMVFKLADTNNDGQISQKEAIDAGNLAVGGFFFRADANGDGVLSKDEARQARDQFMAQNPLLRVVLSKNPNIQATANGNPPAGTPAANAGQAFESLLDSNNDGQLQASEVRTMVQTTVTALFATADTDRSGGLSPTEVNAAMIGMAKTAAQAAFQAADLDKNGSLSQAEFDRAIIEPVHAVFRTIDANNDGQISPDEAQSAQRVVAAQIRMFQVPEPANSAKNLIRSGRNPAEVAPVPSVAPPATTPR